MILLFLLTIFLLLILTGLFYVLVFLCVLLIKKILAKNELREFRKIKKYQRLPLLLSFGLSVLFGCYFLLYNPAQNFKTVHIEKNDGKYIVTILGERSLLSHDLISMFKKDTYIDSIKYEIPRKEGIIDGLEIPNKPGSYKTIKGAGITIRDKTITVSLFYNNYDDQKIDSSAWNGEYELKRRN